MGTITTIYLSGKLAQMIAIPIIREVAALLFAIAIAKDCKARSNGSHILWCLFTLITPLFSGLLYFGYSRFLVENREPKTEEGRAQIKTARKLMLWAGGIYLVSLALAVLAFFTVLASGIAGHATGEFAAESARIFINL